MTFRTLAYASAAVLALGACGRKAEEAQPAPTESVDMNADMNAPNMAVPVSGGQAFANAAAASDAFEIESSKLALTASSSAAVKKFAQAMIDAHTKSTENVKTAASQASPAITPDPTLTLDQQAMIDALQGKSGADFDQAYADNQVAAHSKTLDAVKAYSANGEVPSLKAVAAEMVPIVTAHLNMAKGLKP